jgi:hypothetical protein
MRTQAQSKKLADNLSLGSKGRFCAGTAAACVLHRQVKRGGPGVILTGCIRASFKQEMHRGSAARTDGAVQGRRPIFVLGMDVGSGVEQALDGLHLSFRIPGGTSDVTVRGIMEGTAMTAVRERIRVGSSGQQQSDKFHAVTGRRQMQRRVSDIKPMRYLRLIQPSFLVEAGGEIGVRLKQGPPPRSIVSKNGGKKGFHREGMK